jgi:16S rRNA (guanine966-N2)-methyltransferase
VRIVAGTARGRRLAVPPGTGTRPTSDRTREAVFSRLDAWDAVRDARVLDLYCGSGALALEALSRGAASAVGVEADRAAARVAADNARTLDLDLHVVHDRVERWLGVGAATARGTSGSGPHRTDQVDLVLIDPPYDLADDALERVLAAVAERCAPGAVVVVERARRSPEPAWPEGLHPLEPRRYGETTVWFAERPIP